MIYQTKYVGKNLRIKKSICKRKENLFSYVKMYVGQNMKTKKIDVRNKEKYVFSFKKNGQKVSDFISKHANMREWPPFSHDAKQSNFFSPKIFMLAKI